MAQIETELDSDGRATVAADTNLCQGSEQSVLPNDFKRNAVLQEAFVAAIGALVTVNGLELFIGLKVIGRRIRLADVTKPMTCNEKTPAEARVELACRERQAGNTTNLRRQHIRNSDPFQLPICLDVVTKPKGSATIARPANTSSSPAGQSSSVPVQKVCQALFF